MRKRSRQFRLEVLEDRDMKDGSGLPDVFPDPLFPAPSYDPPVTSVVPPGYNDLGGVILKPIDAGVSGTCDLFKWFLIGAATDIANGRLPGAGPAGPPPVVPGGSPN